MSNLCRICLTQHISKDIFSLPYELNVQETAFEVMKFCLDIDLSEDSEQHHSLCDQCHSLVVKFYKFKSLALKTEQHLRSIKPFKNDDDDNCSTNSETEIIRIDDEIVKNEIKIEPEPSGPSDFPEFHEEPEPSTDGDCLEELEELKPALPKPKIGRPRKLGKDVGNKILIKQECQVCGKKFKYLKLHMLKHMQNETKISCRACKEKFSNMTCLQEHYQNIHKDWEHCKECNKFIRSLAKHTKRYHSHVPKTLECEFCQKMFGSAHALERHLPQHLGDKRFYCHDCEKGFYGKFAIEMHIRRDHMKERFFKCLHCDMDFKTKAHLKRHCLKHTSASKKPKQTCPICVKAYHQLAEHMERHKPVRSRVKNQCKLCKKKFVNASYVKRHYHVVHMGERERCPICQKDVQRLRLHMQLEHSSKNFACDQCPRAFAMPSLLKLHQIKHSDERPHACNQCESRFKRAEVLHRHLISVHSAEKKFLCQICSKTFALKWKLEEHLRSHNTDRLFKCEVCNKMLKTADNLRVHMLRHEGVEKHFCKICDKRFVVSGALRVHMLSHTKEKRYQCRVCDVRFSRSDHRTRHERTAHLCHPDVDKDAATAQFM